MVLLNGICTSRGANVHLDGGNPAPLRGGAGNVRGAGCLGQPNPRRFDAHQYRGLHAVFRDIWVIRGHCRHNRNCIHSKHASAGI